MLALPNSSSQSSWRSTCTQELCFAACRIGNGQGPESSGMTGTGLCMQRDRYCQATANGDKKKRCHTMLCAMCAV